MAGEAMKRAVSALEPEMARRGTPRLVYGKVVLATIHGDIHDIGKTLVGTMLASGGFQVYDLGVDVPVETLIAKALEVKADIIAVSALLTTTMVRQREVIKTLNARGLRAKVQVMGGGGAGTPGWEGGRGAGRAGRDA